MSSLKYDRYWVTFHGFWNFYINFERTVVHHHCAGARAEFKFTDETIASPDLVVELTAVVNSIDRSTENRAPNRCLLFDGIGARHPE